MAHETSSDLAIPAALFVESSEGDYAATGFHHRHRAELAALPEIVKSFSDAGYILEMLTCQDRREADATMRLCYSFNRRSQLDRHLVHADLDPESQEAPTVSHITPAANWFEREVFDMYGVRFREHPYLVRILLPEDADFFALRKDFGRMEAAESASEEDDV